MKFQLATRRSIFEYVKNNENLNLETASEFLLMATWLAYLKSKLLT